MQYYIQFLHKESLMWDRNTEVVILKNGFSPAWKMIEHQDRGPIIWVDMDLDNHKTFDFPNGVAYVSVYYKSELFRVLEWAKQRPDVHFHIGGPIVDTWELSKEIENSLPNFTSHHKTTIERLLFDYDISPKDHWDLIVPDDVYESDIAYGFSISKFNGCWWRKCTFCKQKSVPKYLNYSEIPIIEYPGTKHIWINTYCMRPKDISLIYPNLPDRDDVRYASYLKLNHQSIVALSKAFEKMKCDPSNLAFNVGIEIPSDRLLKVFNRGVSLMEYIDGINFLLHHKCKVAINLIFRLGVIKDIDVEDVKLFAEGITNNQNDLSNITANIYRLHVSQERPIWNYLKSENVKLKKTYRHVWDVDLYNCDCDEKQMKLDNQMLDIYNNLNLGYVWDTIPRGE